MKNIHLLPTDKPSRLYKHNELGFELLAPVEHEIGAYNGSNQHIYITNSEEIKEGDWMHYKHFGEDIVCKYDTMNGQNTNVNEHKPFYQKIILTTDQDLINYGVQAIDDEFLEWFVKNSSCEFVEVKQKDNWFKWIGSGKYHDDEPYMMKTFSNLGDYVYKIIIPKEEPKALTKLEIAKNIAAIGIDKEKPKLIKCYCGHTITCDCEPKQETLEEAAYNYAVTKTNRTSHLIGFIEGAKWQSERMYSEEEVLDLLQEWSMYQAGIELDKLNTKELNEVFKNTLTYKEWFEQFKKK
jgi:hypothetical protein